MDAEQVCAELHRVRDDYRELLDTATVAELRRPTDGTLWNNEQLLFHMLFGYLLVRNLRFVVRGFSRLPDGLSRRFAALLNACTRPFHVVNYVGSLFGARTLGQARMERLMDRVLSDLQTSVRAQPEGALRPGHALPGRLGPLLQRLHDPAGRLPLPDSALRPPPTAAHPRGARG